ncbi:Udp-glycosyltransferase 74g1 [Thalictrum thalictroides]|uniref:Glycosyltransferase n=1 Tax=Thalictrum thalictroides TaxID=46969 RepID=A0A7J6WV47_THATH|nr:Udp-glycosyltransferase 74g1 [Thalictrum thalictroides]
MEKEEDKCWRTHVVFLPLPAHGHINPLLNFAKRLVCKQVKVTIAIPLSKAKSFKTDDDHSKITIEIYNDGSDDDDGGETRTLDSYLKCFKEVGTKNISKIIENYQNSKYPIKCLIYSSVVPYVQDIAKQYGLIGASFFTQSCAVNSIYYHVHHGHLITPVQAPVSLPGLPLLETHELPSVMSVADPDQEPDRSVLHLVTDQFLNVEEIDWLLFNTFDKLEDEVMKWMVKLWPEKAISIGPTVPSIYLKNSPNASNPGSTHSSPYIEWLNTKKARSVVYVSFGTVAKVGEEQIEELTWGIKRSNMYFLWMVREEEQQKLPIKFKDNISEQGLLVSWCSQLEVLAHEAVGCFLTHCGWNSTIEALSMGVPMVAMPQYIDQPTDAKFVEEIWRVGVRAKVDEKGIVRREEIENCIKEIMQGQRREEIKRNAIRWKELAKEAVDEGGSSDKNIDKFIARLVQLS